MVSIVRLAVHRLCNTRVLPHPLRGDPSQNLAAKSAKQSKAARRALRRGEACRPCRAHGQGLQQCMSASVSAFDRVRITPLQYISADAWAVRGAFLRRGGDMRLKVCKRTWVSLLAVPFFLVSFAGLASCKREEERPAYHISAEYVPAAGILYGELTVEVPNLTEEPKQEVQFALYPTPSARTRPARPCPRRTLPLRITRARALAASTCANSRARRRGKFRTGARRSPSPSPSRSRRARRRSFP